jgi:hypothetical protein
MTGNTTPAVLDAICCRATAMRHCEERVGGRITVPGASIVTETGYGVSGSVSPPLEESSAGLRCGLFILSICAFADLDSTD